MKPNPNKTTTTMKRSILQLVCLLAFGAAPTAKADRIFLQSYWQNTIPAANTASGTNGVAIWAGGNESAVSNAPCSANGICLVSSAIGQITSQAEALPPIRPGDVFTDLLSTNDAAEAHHVEHPAQDGPYYIKDYLLAGVSTGQVVQVSLESANFDSYLEVLYLDDGSEFAHNNNGGANANALIAQLPVPNRSLVVRVTTYQPNQTGYYKLSVLSLAPVISSFSPGGGFVGDTVNISGHNLETVQFVTFGGGVWAVPFAQAETSLQVSVPGGALSGVLSATSANGTGSSTNSFIVWNARPQLRALTSGADGSFGFEVAGASGGTVVIEGTTNLAPPIVWLPLQTNMLSGGGTLNFTESGTNRPPRKFYRVRVF